MPIRIGRYPSEYDASSHRTIICLLGRADPRVAYRSLRCPHHISLAAWIAGSNIATKMPMMAITTKSSMTVKPLRFLIAYRSPRWPRGSLARRIVLQIAAPCDQESPLA